MKVIKVTNACVGTSMQAGDCGKYSDYLDKALKQRVAEKEYSS